MNIPIVLQPDAIKPTYATHGSVGFDLYAISHTVIPAKTWRSVPTGVRFQIPHGFEMQIRSRSGLAFKGITVMNQPGTVDSDFRGEVLIILHNNTTRPWSISRGDRIAQAVISPVEIVEFEVVTKLDSTARGESGFGSTGV